MLEESCHRAPCRISYWTLKCLGRREAVVDEGQRRTRGDDGEGKGTGGSNQPCSGKWGRLGDAPEILEGVPWAADPFQRPPAPAPCMPQCFPPPWHRPLQSTIPSTQPIHTEPHDGMSIEHPNFPSRTSPPARMLQNKPAAQVCEPLATPTAIELVDDSASPTITSPSPIVPCHPSDLSSPHPTSTPPRPQ